MSEDTLDKISHIAVVGITPTLIETRVAVTSMNSPASA